ncbi:unnamed protein product [[Candida] boidinii]|nr:unnamed protein product [[Candida] boidinii]
MKLINNALIRYRLKPNFNSNNSNNNSTINTLNTIGSALNNNNILVTNNTYGVSIYGSSNTSQIQDMKLINNALIRYRLKPNFNSNNSNNNSTINTLNTIGSALNNNNILVTNNTYGVSIYGSSNTSQIQDMKLINNALIRYRLKPNFNSNNSNNNSTINTLNTIGSALNNNNILVTNNTYGVSIYGSSNTSQIQDMKLINNALIRYRLKPNFNSNNSNNNSTINTLNTIGSALNNNNILVTNNTYGVSIYGSSNTSQIQDMKLINNALIRYRLKPNFNSNNSNNNNNNNNSNNNNTHMHSVYCSSSKYPVKIFRIDQNYETVVHGTVGLKDCPILLPIGVMDLQLGRMSGLDFDKDYVWGFCSTGDSIRWKRP